MTTQELHNIQIEYFSRPDAEYAMFWDTSDGEEQKNCCYRTPRGKRCAIGCAIPKELYDEGIEGKSIDALIGKTPGFNMGLTRLEDPSFRPEIARLFMGVDVEYMRQSQRLHDDFSSSAPIEHFVYELRKLGAQYGLKEAP